MSYVRVSGLLAVASLMTACGGAAIPQDRLTSAEAAISAADAGGAQGVPDAKKHAKLARENVAEAKRLIADGDNESADEVLKRAEVDAELALALAREATAKAEANAALEEIEKLKKSQKKAAP